MVNCPDLLSIITFIYRVLLPGLLTLFIVVLVEPLSIKVTFILKGRTNVLYRARVNITCRNYNSVATEQCDLLYSTYDCKISLEYYNIVCTINLYYGNTCAKSVCVLKLAVYNVLLCIVQNGLYPSTINYYYYYKICCLPIFWNS